MNETGQQLYHQMLQDVQRTELLVMPDNEKLESCFGTCIKYWNQLRQQLKEYHFTSTEEEILFFKTIKPLFTGHIEYYTRRYQAMLFEPTGSREERIEFWKYEQEKIALFYKNHAAFYTYYRDGHTHKDSMYFVRANSDLSNFPVAKVYDVDIDATTSHDYLVASFIGLELFSAYVKERIAGL